MSFEMTVCNDSSERAFDVNIKLEILKNVLLTVAYVWHITRLIL